MAGAHKRGRGDDDGDAAPPAAKSAAFPRPFCPPRKGGVPQGSELAGLSAAEARACTAAARTQIAAVREAYAALSVPRVAGDLAASDAAYGVLLTATGGCASAQCLAATFIPRFASRAPARLDAAAAALAALAEGPDGGEATLGSATRAAAVAGLALFTATAAVTQGAETRAGKAACATLLRLVAARGDAVAGEALRDALDAAPQAVLSALMLAYVDRNNTALRNGARTWAAALPPPRLEAALASQPATVTWLRASVAALTRGAPPELVAEARPTLDALLRAADVAAPPPGAGELPPPPPLPQWRGRLCKSGAVVCEATAALVPTPRAAPEPRDGPAWPALLDVQARTDTAHVLDVLLPGCRADDVALRRLAPNTAPGEMHAFAAYLLERRRCGVVRLRKDHPGDMQRLLYVIPPAPGVAAALGAEEAAHDAPPVFLWALTLPDKE